jgi:hypothetical protein
MQPKPIDFASVSTRSCFDDVPELMIDWLGIESTKPGILNGNPAAEQASHDDPQKSQKHRDSQEVSAQKPSRLQKRPDRHD